MGSGGNVFKEAERGVRDTARAWKEDPWGQLVKTSTDLMTGTLVKYDPNNGKWSEGSAIHRFDEIVGEIGGRNKARLNNYKAEDNLRAEEAKQATELKNKQLQDYRADVMASRSAQGIRDTSAARSMSSAGDMTPKPGQVLGSDEEEFLGL